MSSDEKVTKKERREQARAARLEAERKAAAQQTRNRRLGILGGILGVAVVIVVVAIVVSSGGSKDKTPKKRAGEVIAGQTTTRQLYEGVPQNGITLGNPKAPATMIEIADLGCPVCKDYSDNIFPRLVNDFVRPGKLKIDLRLIDGVTSQSPKLAHFAAAAQQQNKLWPFTTLVYDNQGQENTSWASDGLLRSIGSGVAGLDVNKMFAASSTSAAQEPTAAATTLANKYDASSTPTLLVMNPKKPTEILLGGAGYPDYGKLSDGIKKAIAQAGGGKSATK